MQVFFFVNKTCPRGRAGLVTADGGVAVGFHGEGIVKGCKGVAVQTEVAIHTPENILRAHML
ncbi:unknown [Prevotella sp. CAG:1124]|nr:unknown [Prevotella sp. CAG:1124]